MAVYPIRWTFSELFSDRMNNDWTLFTVNVTDVCVHAHTHTDTHNTVYRAVGKPKPYSEKAIEREVEGGDCVCVCEGSHTCYSISE